MLRGIWRPLKTALSRFNDVSTRLSLQRSFVKRSRAAWRRYDTKEDDTILQGRARGLSWLDIGKKLGRPWHGVEGRFRRLSTPLSPSSSRLPWTSTDHESLVKGINDGETVSQIAAKFGRTKEAIRIRYRLLVPKSQRPERESDRFSRAQDAVILQLRDMERRTYRSIGQQLGMTVSSISKRYELLSDSKPIKSGPFSASEDDEILRLRVQSGLHFGEIARRLGRRTNTVRLRYDKFLHPGSKPPFSRVGTTRYTEAEDSLILKLRGAGLGWKAMSAEMPGRTPLSIQSRHSRLKDRENWPKEGERGAFKD